MKQYPELNDIAVEVIDLLAKKDISINEARYVLEQAESIMMSKTKIH